MAEVSVLNVNLYGETIGTLTHVGGDRTLFSFTDEYIADGNRPTLGLGFKDEYGQLITEFAVKQKRLLPFFSNLLPEGLSAGISRPPFQSKSGARILSALGLGPRPLGRDHGRARGRRRMAARP